MGCRRLRRGSLRVRLLQQLLERGKSRTSQRKQNIISTVEGLDQQAHTLFQVLPGP